MNVRSLLAKHIAPNKAQQRRILSNWGLGGGCQEGFLEEEVHSVIWDGQGCPKRADV